MDTDGGPLLVIPRATIGTPDPGGRSRLARPLGVVLAHYIGVDSTTRYLGADFPSPSYELDLRDAKAIAGYGVAAGKSWEYNFLIGASGATFEQAGDFRAAHCSKMNDRSIGVLLMLGNGRRPSTAMIQAWHDLIGWLQVTGRLSASPELAPHYRYRWTDCPDLCATPRGKAAPSKWTGEGYAGDLIPDLLERPVIPPRTDDLPPVPAPEPDPEPTPPIEGDAMPTARIITIPGYANQFLVGAGDTLHLSPLMRISFEGVPVVSGAVSEDDPTRPHPQLLAMLLHQTGLTMGDLTPVG